MKKVVILLFLIPKILIFCSVLSAAPSKKDYAYKLSIAAIFKNESFYLKEWIEYHRIAGVEHFWLYNNSSTDNGLEILAPYVKQGIVDVVDWPTRDKVGNWSIEKSLKNKISNRLMFAITQREAYHNALKRSAGITKWLAVIDLDEFLVPLQEATVTETLEKHFTRASAVYVNWLTFGTSNITLKDQESILFNLVQCSPIKSSINKLGKSIVRTDHAVFKNTLLPFIDVHYFVMDKKNQHYYNGDGDLMAADPIFEDTFDKKNHREYSKGYFAKFIRINHYKMGDEKYFCERRIGKQQENSSQSQENLLADYHLFNREKDFSIISYIENKHTEKYKALWNNGFFSRVYVGN